MSSSRSWMENGLDFGIYVTCLYMKKEILVKGEQESMKSKVLKDILKKQDIMIDLGK